MEITVTYDKDSLTLSLPDNSFVDQFAPTEGESGCNGALFQKRFNFAGGAGFLSSANPLVIVNDGYRNTPTETVLSWLDNLSPDILDRITALVSTGSHEKPSEFHMHKVFGKHLERLTGRVLTHDATDLSTMNRVGTDRFGCDVYLNREVLSHESVLIIGSVEPHYFAGYTGGRKALFPGLTDLATIERNHNLACDLAAAPLALKGNPVAEHLEELLGLVDASRYLSVQLIVNKSGEVADIYAGDIRESFDSAAKAARVGYARETRREYDLVIAEMCSPLDKNLYQLQKGLENCQSAVKDGGTVVLVSACEEGIGSHYFFELAEIWDRDTNCPSDGVERFGSHKLARVNLIGKRIRILLHSKLPDDVVRKVFYEPLDKPQEFIDDYLAGTDRASIAVVHDAGHTVLTKGGRAG